VFWVGESGGTRGHDDGTGAFALRRSDRAERMAQLRQPRFDRSDTVLDDRIRPGSRHHLAHLDSLGDPGRHLCPIGEDRQIPGRGASEIARVEHQGALAG